MISGVQKGMTPQPLDIDMNHNEEVTQHVVQDHGESLPRGNENTTEDVYTSMEDQMGSQEHLIHQHQDTSSNINTGDSSWTPDTCAFLLAFLALSPFLSYICYKMRVAAVLYLAMHFASIPLAFKLRDKSGWVRWVSGFFVVAFLAQIKTIAMMTNFQDDSFMVKSMFYAFTAFWECSNAVHIFGGRALLDRYGISSYGKALLAVTCPVQLKFTHQPCPKDRLLQRSLHLGYYFIIFVAMRFLLQPFEGVVEFMERYVVLEAEALVILISCIVNIWNIPPHIYHLVLMNYPIQIIYPYGSIYFSQSSRDFWSKWGRPASSIIRHMFYYPLGGSGRAWLSIPLMFLLNASSHYSVSDALVGDKAEIGWNTVFGVLGLVATLEVFGNQFFERRATHSEGGSQTELVSPRWWYRVRFITALVALRFAAYIFIHKCLDSSLSGLTGQ